MPGTESDDGVVVLGHGDVSDFNEDNILPETPDTLKKIHEWLNPTAYDGPGSEYRKHSALHLANTGSWLLSSDAYFRWRSSREDGVLWIRGTSEILAVAGFAT